MKNIMRNRTLLLGLGLIALFVVTVYFSSCNQVPPVSIQDRLSMFFVDMNADNYGSLKGHTHPSAAKYNLADATWWGTGFPIGDSAYTIASNTPSGDTLVTTITSTTTYAGTAIKFVFKEDEPKVWKILSIDIGNNGFSAIDFN